MSEIIGPGLAARPKDQLSPLELRYNTLLNENPHLGLEGFNVEHPHSRTRVNLVVEEYAHPLHKYFPIVVRLMVGYEHLKRKSSIPGSFEGCRDLLDAAQEYGLKENPNGAAVGVALGLHIMAALMAGFSTQTINGKTGPFRI